MRWETSKTESAIEVYNLYKDEKKILTLTFNPFSDSARIECNKQKRVFLIRKEGFRKHKTVIRDEYGFKIGELGTENKLSFINVLGEKFFYTCETNPLSEMILYKDSKENPLVTCSFKENDGTTSVHFEKDKNLSSTSHPGLLMALCWYMFLPVAKENAEELA